MHIHMMVGAGYQDDCNILVFSVRYPIQQHIFEHLLSNSIRFPFCVNIILRLLLLMLG